MPVSHGEADDRDDAADAAEGTDDTESAEDAAWRELVANYGERAVLEDEHPSFGQRERVSPEPPESGEPAAPAESTAPPGSGDSDGRDDPAESADDSSYEEERFVPPTPGPVPMPQGPRLAAWSGVFVPPAVLLVCALLQFRLPSPLGPLLVIWFLVGFGWLVWQMPRGPREPWDNGAQV